MLKNRGSLTMANRYRVVVNIPSLVAAKIEYSRGAEALNLMCDATGLPGRQIMTLDYQAQKQVIKIPYGFINEDVTFTFMLTGDYFAKKVFDAWSSAVMDFDNYRVKYFNEFTSTVSIYQTAKGGEPESFRIPPPPPPASQNTGNSENPEMQMNVTGERPVAMQPFVVAESRVRDDFDVYGIRLNRAYPVTLSGINLDNAGENTIQKYQVTMAYENFEVIDLSSQQAVRTAPQ